MAGVRIRALTERHPIKPTSLRCHSAWQLNLGRPPLIDAEDLFRQPGPPHKGECETSRCLQSCKRGGATMRISEVFIRRRVGTSLLAVGIILLGAIAYMALPVASLPQG